MTISELIERLEALKAEHGDLPVEASTPFVQRWYLNNDPQPPFVMLRQPYGL